MRQLLLKKIQKPDKRNYICYSKNVKPMQCIGFYFLSQDFFRETLGKPISRSEDPGILMEATPGFEPGNKGFADLCLTTWLCRRWLG